MHVGRLVFFAMLHGEAAPFFGDWFLLIPILAKTVSRFRFSDFKLFNNSQNSLSQEFTSSDILRFVT